MATNIAEIGFIVDTSQLKTAKTALDQLTPAARATEQAQQALTQTMQQTASAAGAVVAGTSRITAAIQAQEAATVRAVHANGIYVDSAGRVRAAGAAFVHTAGNVVSAAQLETAAIGGTANALDNAVQSYARATTAAGHYINAAGRVVNAQGRFVSAAQAAADKAELAALAQRSQAAAADAATAAQNRLNQATQQGNKDIPIMGLNTANLAAQFQDIGVTAAMGMNPLMIALQQGTQISAVLAQNGATAASSMRMLGEAFKSVVSPLALATIGIVALVAGLIQLVPWTKVAETSLRATARGLRYMAEAIAFATQLLVAFTVVWAVLNFGTVIAGLTAVAAVMWRIAAAGAAATAAVGFLPIALTAAIGAVIYFRKEIAKALGPDMIAMIKAPFNFIIGIAAGTFGAVVEIFKSLPNAFRQVANGFVTDFKGMLNSVLEAANEVVKQLPWWLGGSAEGVSFRFDASKGIFQVEKEIGSLGERMKGVIEKSMGTDWIGKIGEQVGNGVNWVAGKFDKLADSLAAADKKYEKLVRTAEKEIALLKIEQQGVGQAALQYNILREQIELVAKAKEQDIKLTPAMETQLRKLGTTIGTLKTQTEALQGAFNFSRDVVGGFVRDLRDGLKNGEGFLKSFANAAVNILNKVSDRLIDLSLDFLFQSQKGGAAGGPLGGLVKLFGGLFPGAGSQLGGWSPTVTMNAKGNVFGRGGILNEPTLFKFAKGGSLGMAGEAGAEAVMPLKRGPDGSLGVAMHGASNDNGPAVVVQVINNANGTEVRQERTQNGDGTEVRKIIIDTVRGATAQGELDGVQRARFGNAPTRVIR